MTITRNIQIPDTKNTITVEIELSCSELETAYREQERYYRLMDAEGQLCTYLGFDVSDFDPDNEDDAEKLESFKEKFGDTEPVSLVDEESPNYVLNDIVAQFEHDADCNNDVNSTWQNAVEEVLNILQARLCYEAVSDGTVTLLPIAVVGPKPCVVSARLYPHRYDGAALFRYIVVDAENIGIIYDDAQGYGYKSAEAAKRAFSHKYHGMYPSNYAWPPVRET